MTWDRVAIVERQLDTYLDGAEPAAHRLDPHSPLHAATTLTAGTALGIFEDQLASRQIDVAARELKKTGRSYIIEGQVKTRGDAPQNLAKALEYLGPPDAEGRRPFSVAGTL